LGVVAVATPVLKHYLHLHSIVPVLLFGVFMALSIVSIIPRAVLFGRMQFSTVAIGLIVNGVSRCVFGVLFVELHLGLNGAMLATVFGAALQIVVYAKPIRTELLKLGPIQERLVRYRSVLLATMSLGGVSAFIGVDSVLARHYLPGKESGYYVAAATGARIALFLPGAIQQMAFPRLTRTIDKPLENRKMFHQNLVIVAILAVGATIGILLFSHVVLAILFGSKFRSAAPTIRILALSAAEMGVISYFTYYFLAHKSAFAVISWIGVVGAGIFIWQFHSDPAQIAEMMLGSTSATLLFQWYGLWRLR
jgi:O-antigen/teichoic acid export membrane protein